MLNWAQEEMQTANLGDERLNARLASFLGRLADRPGDSIPAACRGLAETMAAYRFLDNEKVTFDKVLQPHQDATLQRMHSCPVVLLAQDTTEMDKWVNLGPKGLGTLKSQQKFSRRLHPTVASLHRDDRGSRRCERCGTSADRGAHLRARVADAQFASAALGD